MRAAPDVAVRAGGARSGAAVLTAIVLGWMGVILAVYYRQLWPLLAAPGGWTMPELGQGFMHRGLPFAYEAALRAASAIGTAAVILTALTGAGWLLDRWLTPASLAARERVVVRLGNGACAWSLFFLGLAAAGWYRPAVVRVALGAAAALTILSVIRRPPVDVREWRRQIRSGVLQGLPWSAITLAGVLVAFVTALAPETEYDALWYHLELPRRWLAAGRPIDDITEYISLYPLGWQLLYGGALAFDGAPAARLLHWSAFLASAVVASAIGTRALGARAPWLTAAIFVTAPTVLWEATAAYNDLATALHTGIGAGALWIATRTPSRSWMLLAVVQLGFACSTKHLALVPLGITLALHAAHRWRAAGAIAAIGSASAVGAVVLVLASPWYIRSWVASGNPVFPEMFEVFGAEPPERWDRLTEDGLARFKSRFGGEQSVSGLLALPWDMTMHAARYGGTLGPLLLMLITCIPLVWRGSGAARWLIAGALLYLIVWASPVSSYQLRFLVPWWVFMAPVLARAAERGLEAATRTGRAPAVAMRALVLVALVLNLPPFTPLHERDRAGWTGWLTHVVRRAPVEVIAGGISEDAYLRREVRTFGAWSYLNEHAPEDARVLTFFGGDHFYANRARLWSDTVVARPLTWGATSETPATLRSRLSALGITHVMAPPRPRQSGEHVALSLLQPEMIGRELDAVYEDAWAVVYEVRQVPRRAVRTTDQR